MFDGNPDSLYESIAGSDKIIYEQLPQFYEVCFPEIDLVKLNLE
jgi:hypothetical protein